MHTLVLLDSFGLDAARLTGQKLRDRSHDVDLNRIVSCNAYDANSSPLYSTQADCQGHGKSIVRLRDVVGPDNEHSWRLELGQRADNGRSCGQLSLAGTRITARGRGPYQPMSVK